MFKGVFGAGSSRSKSSYSSRARSDSSDSQSRLPTYNPPQEDGKKHYGRWKPHDDYYGSWKVNEEYSYSPEEEQQVRRQAGVSDSFSYADASSEDREKVADYMAGFEKSQSSRGYRSFHQAMLGEEAKKRAEDSRNPPDKSYHGAAEWKPSQLQPFLSDYDKYR